MKFSIITLFPEMFSGPFSYSIVKRAVAKEQITIDIINLRDFATDAYKSVDDRPYGGGAGMLLKVDVVDRALQRVKSQIPAGAGRTNSKTQVKTILLDAGGTPYKQSKAKQLAADYTHIVLLCGHYEGIDERIRALVDEELSIGDYVLTGGEIPAMVVVDSVTRLVQDVLTNPVATEHESFTQNLLEYPQYTRPETYHGIPVPDVLRSGDPKKIKLWQTQEAITKTKKKRPDLTE